MEHPMEKTHFLSFFAYVTSDRISGTKSNGTLPHDGTRYDLQLLQSAWAVSSFRLMKFHAAKKSGISVGLFSLYSAEVIVPPPTTISPSYSTTA